MRLLTLTVLLWWGSTLAKSSLVDCTAKTKNGLYSINYDYYPAYYANWGPDHEVEMTSTANLWQFLPVKSENYVYLRSYLQKDYIYDAHKGKQAARLHRSPGTKFKIMCDHNCETLHSCQIRTDEGRKLYTSYYLNTKFCLKCGSESWFWWSLDPPTSGYALVLHEAAQNASQDTSCRTNNFCTGHRKFGPDACCCKRQASASQGFCIHHELCVRPNRCMHDDLTKDLET